MPGKIWEVEHSSGTVWLILSDVALRMHRRISLAVDRTDSTAGSEASLRMIATELARALDVGDVVSIWRMGESNSLREIQIKGETSRNDLIQLVTGLGVVQTGSWFCETWGAMRSASASPGADFVDFPMLISDGEIFDTGAIETMGGSAPLWYRLRGGEGTPTPELTRSVREGTASAEGMKKDIAVQAVSTRLQVRARGVRRAFSFDEAGKLGGEISIEDLDQIPYSRVALVGGKVDSATLMCSSVRSMAIDDAFERIVGKWPEDPRLLSVLKEIGGGKVSWDRERLQLLASGAKHFRCRFDGKESPASQLFCIECGCFLLAVDRIELVDIYPLRWKFALSESGVGEAVEAGAGCSTGKAMGLTIDERGRWMVLDLGAA